MSLARSLPTRRQLLQRGAGVAVAGAAGLTARGSGAEAATTAAAETDPDRLHRLVSVEMLVLFCYDQVLSSAPLTPRAHRLISPARGQEEAHIRILRSHLNARGGVPPAPPETIQEANRQLARAGVGGRLGQLQGARDALFLLLAVEQRVIGTYFSALGKFSDPRLIRLSAQIMANDAQHQALVGVALNPGNTQKAVPSGLVQGIQ
jgi:hypothetical protein